jgi:hypothetical protein
MRRGTFFAILFLLVGTAAAQPWQWQRYAGNYYHPTEFPAPQLIRDDGSVEAVGDFDGNGQDDFFSLTESGFLISVRDADTTRMHWTTQLIDQHIADLNSCTGVTAVNLDQDPAKELIVFAGGISAWKTTNTNPWTLEQRDDLLADYYFPPNTLKAVFADYDGDGYLNGVYFAAPNWHNEIQYYTRQTDGGWALDSTLTLPQPTWVDGLYDGDFNQDGYVDFAVVYMIPDWGNESIFYKNTGHGFGRQYAADNLNMPGPTGGDLDGDGQWEGLFVMTDRPGYNMLDLEPDSTQFIRRAGLKSLASLAGPVIGNLRFSGTQYVTGVMNKEYFTYVPTSAYRLVKHTPFGWQEPTSRVLGANAIFVSACIADVDGNGLNDMFSVMREIPEMGTETFWFMWQNTGSVVDDWFDLLANDSRHWLNNPDTVFSSPQIGDVTGDGVAEFAVLAQPNGQQSQVLFCATNGQFSYTGFTLVPGLNLGIQQGISQLRLADIDGDGLCEAMCYDATGWHTFFRRNGSWQEYENILPPITTSDISFADADNDGDLDLFTPTELWLNLNPSGTKPRTNPLPTSFGVAAYPNPFNSTTSIRLDLLTAGKVTIRIYDLMGREVQSLANANYSAGMHTFTWDGSRFASGLYFVRAQAGEKVQVQKLALLK